MHVLKSDTAAIIVGIHFGIHGDDFNESARLDGAFQVRRQYDVRRNRIEVKAPTDQGKILAQGPGYPEYREIAKYYGEHCYLANCTVSTPEGATIFIDFNLICDENVDFPDPLFRLLWRSPEVWKVIYDGEGIEQALHQTCGKYLEAQSKRMQPMGEAFVAAHVESLVSPRFGFIDVANFLRGSTTVRGHRPVIDPSQPLPTLLALVTAFLGPHIAHLFIYSHAVPKPAAKCGLVPRYEKFTYARVWGNSKGFDNSEVTIDHHESAKLHHLLHTSQAILDVFFGFIFMHQTSGFTVHKVQQYWMRNLTKLGEHGYTTLWAILQTECLDHFTQVPDLVAPVPLKYYDRKNEIDDWFHTNAHFNELLERNGQTYYSAEIPPAYEVAQEARLHSKYEEYLQWKTAGPMVMMWPLGVVLRISSDYRLENKTARQQVVGPYDLSNSVPTLLEMCRQREKYVKNINPREVTVTECQLHRYRGRHPCADSTDFEPASVVAIPGDQRRLYVPNFTPVPKCTDSSYYGYRPRPQPRFRFPDPPENPQTVVEATPGDYVRLQESAPVSPEDRDSPLSPPAVRVVDEWEEGDDEVEEGELPQYEPRNEPIITVVSGADGSVSVSPEEIPSQPDPGFSSADFGERSRMPPVIGGVRSRLGTPPRYSTSRPRSEDKPSSSRMPDTIPKPPETVPKYPEPPQMSSRPVTPVAGSSSNVSRPRTTQPPPKPVQPPVGPRRKPVASRPSRALQTLPAPPCRPASLFERTITQTETLWRRLELPRLPRTRTENYMLPYVRPDERRSDSEDLHLQHQPMTQFPYQQHVQDLQPLSFCRPTPAPGTYADINLALPTPFDSPLADLLFAYTLDGDLPEHHPNENRNWRSQYLHLLNGIVERVYRIVVNPRFGAYSPTQGFINLDGIRHLLQQIQVYLHPYATMSQYSYPEWEVFLRMLGRRIRVMFFTMSNNRLQQNLRIPHEYQISSQEREQGERLFKFKPSTARTRKKAEIRRIEFRQRLASELATESDSQVETETVPSSAPPSLPASVCGESSTLPSLRTGNAVPPTALASEPTRAITPPNGAVDHPSQEPVRESPAYKRSRGESEVSSVPTTFTPLRSASSTSDPVFVVAGAPGAVSPSVASASPVSVGTTTVVTSSELSDVLNDIQSEIDMAPLMGLDPSNLLRHLSGREPGTVNFLTFANLGPLIRHWVTIDHQLPPWLDLDHSDLNVTNHQRSILKRVYEHQMKHPK